MFTLKKKTILLNGKKVGEVAGSRTEYKSNGLKIAGTGYYVRLDEAGCSYGYDGDGGGRFAYFADIANEIKCGAASTTLAKQLIDSWSN